MFPLLRCVFCRGTGDMQFCQQGNWQANMPCVAIANHDIVGLMGKANLSRDTFHILVALADRDRHGYAIMQDIAERTEGRVRLRPSSLYSAIHRMLEDGL